MLFYFCLFIFDLKKNSIKNYIVIKRQYFFKKKMKKGFTQKCILIQRKIKIVGFGSINISIYKSIVANKLCDIQLNKNLSILFVFVALSKDSPSFISNILHHVVTRFCPTSAF